MSYESGYFDVNATTSLSSAARDAWLKGCDEFWHNPSSLYREAGMARQELERCREEVADCLGLDEPERVIFTSGATEANNAVLQYLASNRDGDVLVSAIEHPCVTAPAQAYFGAERYRELPVDSDTGIVNMNALESSLAKGGLAAVSIMAANNETGTLQPWQEIASRCREHGIPFHTDAAQWIGKLPAKGLGACDFFTGSGHKFEGAKGAGFLVIPEELNDFHGLIGGPQEEGKRAGTENLPSIMAMTAALEEKNDESLEAIAASALTLRDGFESELSEKGFRLVGNEGPRLWNTSMIVLPHTKNLKWLTRLSARGYSVSTGSACSSGRGNPSRVMEAMGLSFEEMGQVLRISSGWETGQEDWDGLIRAILEVEEELRQ